MHDPEDETMQEIMEEAREHAENWQRSEEEGGFMQMMEITFSHGTE